MKHKDIRPIYSGEIGNQTNKVGFGEMPEIESQKSKAINKALEVFGAYFEDGNNFYGSGVYNAIEMLEQAQKEEPKMEDYESCKGLLIVNFSDKSEHAKIKAITGEEDTLHEMLVKVFEKIVKNES